MRMVVCCGIVMSGLAAAETRVSNAKELHAALAAARPGTTIVMKNGIWQDVRIDMTKPGTVSAPVSLKAETNGAVILRGTSQLVFSAKWQTVSGLCFKDGGGTYDKKYFAVVRFNADNCRLTESAIVDFTTADPMTKYYYVYFAGNANRMDHCLLTGKSNNEPVVGNDDEGSRHNRVDHCVVRDIPYIADNNGREIFRIFGYGHHDVRGKGEKGAFFMIEQNLFDHADGEGTEIISLKSDSNIVRNNIIRASQGEISLRMGDGNRIEGNVILGEKGPRSWGIRIAGHGHTIVNNVIRDCQSGIRLMCGEYIEKGLTGSYEPKLSPDAPLGRMATYGWVHDCVIANNTLVNSEGPDFVMGYRYKNKWPAAQLILLPEHNAIANNFIVKAPGRDVVEETAQDMTPPFDVVKFRPNKFSGNVCIGGKVTVPSAANGFTMREPAQGTTGVLPSPGAYGLSQNAHEDILRGENVGPSWQVNGK